MNRNNIQKQNVNKHNQNTNYQTAPLKTTQTNFKRLPKVNLQQVTTQQYK